MNNEFYVIIKTNEFVSIDNVESKAIELLQTTQEDFRNLFSVDGNEHDLETNTSDLFLVANESERGDIIHSILLGNVEWNTNLNGTITIDLR